jgi:hypothetical protein
MQSVVIIVAMFGGSFGRDRASTDDTNRQPRLQRSRAALVGRRESLFLALTRCVIVALLMVERIEMEKLLDVLRPYASNWSGSLGRGDLVIPQREIPRLIHDILEAVHQVTEQGHELTDADLFHALSDVQHLPSLQDQAARLRQQYRIFKR